MLVCNGVHEVKVGKTAAKSFVLDKFNCKVTLPTTDGTVGKAVKGALRGSAEHQLADDLWRLELRLQRRFGDVDVRQRQRQRLRLLGRRQLLVLG